MSNFTFLENDQIFSENRLDMFKKYGTKCAITDFSILLGGYVSSTCYTNEGNDLKDRTGAWWTKTPDSGFARAVVTDGDRYCYDVNSRNVGARPAIPYSLISKIASNEVRGSQGILEVQYGEFPQWVEEQSKQDILEQAYNNILDSKITGKKYTTDSVAYDSYTEQFKKREFLEYVYNGSKYIRFTADTNSAGNQLSNGTTIIAGQPYWIKVEPIIWLVDKVKDVALAKYILFAGVQFQNDNNYRGDFSKTDINKYTDTFFSKEIIPTSRNLDQLDNLNNTKSKRQRNPYGFDFSRVTEEEIIRGALESSVPIFLHGKSGDGKSARVKQFDPECEIIYMRNATPDSLNGKSVYNATTGEMIDIPPTWYSKIKEKCEKEPDKIHIVFFDELTNALPSIQGMAFNIVLDKEINGIWKLPPNARIVAAGNDLEDSLAANQLAEPLYNRFAHVYINTTVNSWLKWATTPEENYERLNYDVEKPNAKIHPSIYAYIAYKSYSGEDVLRTPFTGKKPNADPRKWELASKILYKTKQPEMLRALIGEDLTSDFIWFTSQYVISVEDVLNHNYSDEDFEMDTAQKFATAVGLSSVDDKNFSVVRDFMKRVGAEPKAAFESMWTHGDESRLEYLSELQMADNLSQGGIKK